MIDSITSPHLDDPFRILLVEDDISHAELTKECFDQAKLLVKVDEVEDGAL